MMIFSDRELQRFRGEWAAILEDAEIVRYLAGCIEDSDGRVDLSARQSAGLRRIAEAVRDSGDARLDLGPERGTANELLGHLLAQEPVPDRPPCRQALDFASAVAETS